MLVLKKIAVTGGLSCGKSTVCQIFQECGAYVVNADQIVHQLLTSADSVRGQVIDLLGEEIVEKGWIQRRLIADLVFKDKKQLKELEHILYPEVTREIEKQYLQAKNDPSLRLFVAEIPLLFEAGWEIAFDNVVTVAADPEIAKKRFQSQGKTDYLDRMSQQMTLKEKIDKADVVIYNNGSLADLKKQVKQIYKQLTT